MVYHTIEQRVGVYQQIQELKLREKIEITTYNRDFYLSSWFLRSSETNTQLAYFLEADGEKITISNKRDQGFFSRRRKIKIKRISKIFPLQEKVNSQ